jgi:hypothetical protein
MTDQEPEVCDSCGEPIEPQSLTERAYLALAELAGIEAEEGLITTEDLFGVVTAYANDTDSTTNDARNLASLVVTHLKTQTLLRERMGHAYKVIERVNASDIDLNKIEGGDQDEWTRLVNVAQSIISPDEVDVPELTLPDGEVTLEELMKSIETNVIIEAASDERVRNAAIYKVKYDAHMADVIANLLHAHVVADREVIHAIIDHYECRLVHSLCTFIVRWIGTRKQLDPSMGLDEFLHAMVQSAHQTQLLTDDEKIELSQRFYEEGEDGVTGLGRT